MAPSLRQADRNDVGFRNHAHAGEHDAHGVGGVGRCEVPIVLFDHAGVRVPELRSDDGQGRAGHDQPGCVAVTQIVSRDAADRSELKGCPERALMIRFPVAER